MSLSTTKGTKMFSSTSSSNTSTKHSFVIDINYQENFEDDILRSLNLIILTEESDLALGYYTVIGSQTSITELKQYLNGTRYL